MLILTDVWEIPISFFGARHVAMAVGFDGRFYLAFLRMYKAVELKPCSAIRHSVILIQALRKKSISILIFDMEQLYAARVELHSKTNTICLEETSRFIKDNQF